MRTYALLILALAGCSESPSLTVGEAPRVVSLVPSVNDIIVALGGTRYLVARTDYDAIQLAHLPSVGGNLDPSIEFLLRLNPTLVITGEDSRSFAPSVFDPDFGIDVLRLPTETVDAFHRTVDTLGALLDLERAADSLSHRVSFVFDSLAVGHSRLDPIRVAVVIWTDPPMVAGGGSFMDDLVRVSGGENVFGDSRTRWPTVSYESLVDRDPDVLVISDETTTDPLPELQTAVGWREVRAVQEGSVLVVDRDVFGRPGPQLATAAVRFSTILDSVRSTRE